MFNHKKLVLILIIIAAAVVVTFALAINKSNITDNISGAEISGAENVESSSASTGQIRSEKNSSGTRTRSGENSGSDNTNASEAAENTVSTSIELIDTLQPGTIIDEASISDSSSYFKTYEIHEGDDIYNRINGKSYRQNKNISLCDLRYLKLLYYDFNDQIKVGEIIEIGRAHV